MDKNDGWILQTYTQSWIYRYSSGITLCVSILLWVQFRGNPLQGKVVRLVEGKVVRLVEAGVRAEGGNEPHALQKQPEGNSHFGRLVI